MNIRLFEQTDAIAVSELIRKTIRISNVKDYPLELMEALIDSETPQHVIERASWTHFYVAEEQGELLFTDYGISGICTMQLSRIYDRYIRKFGTIFFHRISCARFITI